VLVVTTEPPVPPLPPNPGPLVPPKEMLPLVPPVATSDVKPSPLVSALHRTSSKDKEEITPKLKNEWYLETRRIDFPLALFVKQPSSTLREWSINLRFVKRKEAS
jgi:hypothetical protein